MKKFLSILSIVTLLAASISLFAPATSFAAPAQPNQGNLCFVQDANLVQYTVPCQFHEVFKTDEDGNIVALLTYQDKAQLPPEAALPTSTFHSVIHVDCGCIYDGDYPMTLTPSGHYESHGPANN